MNSIVLADTRLHDADTTRSTARTPAASMKTIVRASLAGLCIAVAALTASSSAHAHPDASAASTLSALPLASLVVGGSAVAGSVVAVPVALSTAGAVLVVKTIESTARGTVLVLERVSDGARVSVELVGKGLHSASVAVGTAVTVSVIAAGCLLSAAGEAIAFVPNRLGESLLHNQQVAY